MDKAQLLKQQIDLLKSGQSLTDRGARDAVSSMMSGEAPRDLVASWLLALREKGETAAEVAGAAVAMREAMIRLPTVRQHLIDTCGTGGDGSGAFNISTAAAIVAAAAGANVAKHGNRSISSKSGSADVLSILGVKIDCSVETTSRCLDELGICFCFAPNFHPAMKHVGPIRKELGVPTVFNLLGPLANPAGVQRQVLGVGKAKFRPLIAEAMRFLGAERVAVVHGDDGIDEVSLSGSTSVTLINGNQTTEHSWRPEDFGIVPQERSRLLVDGPRESAERISQVLKGEPGPCRDVVVLNAAAALFVAEKNEDLVQCACAAAEAIDSGAAQRLLADWAALSNE
jgi:anthranilate phosphoribosyltransferase